MKSRATLLLLLISMNILCRSQITITFNVDVTGQKVEAGGVHIAGQFAIDNGISITQDWDPGAAGSQMTKTSSNVYTIQVTFSTTAAGKKLEFEFVRNNVWSSYEDFSEGNPGDPNAHLDNSCGVPDGGGGYNRIITIPSCRGQFDAVFNYCGVLTTPTEPLLTLSPDKQICLGQSAQLHATSNFPVEWAASPSLSCLACSDPVASPTTTTSYTARASNAGCTVEDSVLVTVDTSTVKAGNDQVINPGASTQLSATGASSFSWKPAAGLSCTMCPSPVAGPAVTTTYVVYGFSGNGCKSSDTVTVYVAKSPCENIFFPTVFSPNNDNKNDKFGPLSKVPILPGFKAFKIYNRWGELVFETKEYSQKWDGRYRGVDQPPGSYVYFLQLDCNGNHVVLKGVVTMLK